jgi:MoaA/NifB/PqqE/SkfB family radical SAM enzyme
MKTLAEKVDEFQENGFKIETIKFCGSTGEPLVNPATIAGIEIFKNKRKKLVLFTNGLFLGNMNEKKLYWQYALNLDKINLSLDSGSEETFAELKHCNGYSSIIHSLELMVAEREMRREKTDIVASYVIGRKNRHEILATAKKMKEIGVDEIRFRVDLTDVDGVRDFSGQILDELREAQKLQGDGFRVNSVYSEDEIGEDNSAFNSYGRRCFNHHFWASIGPDCELYSCGHRTRGEVRSYGSILDSNFRSLWLSKERQESTRKLPDEYCAICSPSSVRRNNLMNFLATLSIEEVRRLYKKYVIKQIDKTP